MRSFSNKTTQFVFIQTAFIVFLIGLCLYATGFRTIPAGTAVLFAGSLAISLSGLFGGLLLGLGISLAALFVLGTVLIWGTFVSSVEILSVQDTVVWMIAIVASSLISGTLHRWASTTVEENRVMNAKFEELVTIDEMTGFDNKKRFHFEMEEEFKRSVRTGTPFSLLFIELKYFDEFERLYGGKEAAHLVKTLSDVLWKQTRISDRKFRIEAGLFAVILFNTGEDNVHYVLKKIEDLVRHHKLANEKKEVTITVAFGSSSFSGDYTDYTELIQHASHDLEQYTQ
ncbi:MULTISPECIES: GGDEF domain-containing protein [Paenibacillus]|uniref:GGDEF domain-containing protein n=1 Tax=Paenibacillus TaxID=44249 RepID=UPI0022B92D04|nr:diguanylate cyclase [Paenibacillus caseinilyticus]MCZ8523523.1 diguanylate cyclase [Paenibacillus caseinilyticus]